MCIKQEIENLVKRISTEMEEYGSKVIQRLRTAGRAGLSDVKIREGECRPTVGVRKDQESS